MQYMGSKNRFAKELVPIIQSYIDNNNIENYLEPFVGGGNIIDKIKCKNKYGSDNQKYLIALLKKIRDDVKSIPFYITEEEYNIVKDNKENYDDWYVGLVGFTATFANKFFGGCARSKIKTTKEYSKTAINNLKKQAPNLKNITFKCCDFRDIKPVKNFVIYCDPPYRNTTKYGKEQFPYDEFYDWCKRMSKDNIVLISEYNMPNDFKCIWKKETKANFDSNRTANNDKNNRIEKLFIYKGEKNEFKRIISNS